MSLEIYVASLQSVCQTCLDLPESAVPETGLPTGECILSWMTALKLLAWSNINPNS